MKKILILVALAGLGASGAYLYSRNGKEVDTDKPELITAKVERGTITSYVRTTGRVVANRDVEIKCKASGQVIALTKDVSDIVKPGELLLELDPVDELRAVKQSDVNVQMSRAQLEQSRESVRIAESTLEADKARAEAAYNSAVAKARDAAEKAKRMKLLLEKQLASPEEYESAETAAVQATTELRNASIKRNNDIKTQEMSLELRRQDVILAEASVMQDLIASATAHQRLVETKVYAPPIESGATVAGESDSTGTGSLAGGSRLGGMRSAGGRPEGRGGFGGPPGRGGGELDSASTGSMGARFGGGRARGTGMGSGGGREFAPDRRSAGAEGFDPATSRGLAGRGGFGGERSRSGGGGMDGMDVREAAFRPDFKRPEGSGPERGFPPGGGFRGARDEDERAAPSSNEGVWYVSGRQVQIGQIIASGVSNVGGGTAIMTLSDLSHVFIYANVDESDIGKVLVGQDSEITVDAYPDETFRGRVIRIATKGVVNSNVVTFEVRIEVVSRNKTLLKPEMTANVDIITAHKADTLVVPAEVVMRRRGDQIVLVRNDDGTSTPKTVELGVTDGFQTELLSGVDEGATVVAFKSEGDSRFRGGGPPRGMMMMGGGMRGSRGGGPRR